MAGDPAILTEIYQVIASRKGGDPSTSYTAKLFDRGLAKIAQKFGEEAVETIVAATAEGRDEVVTESADLFYHLMVLWAEVGVEPGEVFAVLENRFGTSGIEEKKARKKS